jgi:tetratricopeptide (TPR) repeat protein
VTLKLSAATFAALIMVGFTPLDVLRSTPAIRNERGRREYDHRDYSDAARSFGSAVEAGEAAPELLFNEATARYKTGDYEGALGRIGPLRSGDGKSQVLTQKAHYNAGNAHFKLTQYDEAIEAYEQALEVDSGDADARHNLELARRAKEREQQTCEDASCDKPGCTGGHGEPKEGEGEPSDEPPSEQGASGEEPQESQPRPPQGQTPAYSNPVEPPPPPGKEYPRLDEDKVDDLLRAQRDKERRLRSQFNPEPRDPLESPFGDDPFGLFGDNPFDRFGDPFEDDSTDEKDW